MAYNQFLADRINKILKEKKANFFEKKMFGGLCYMVNDKMCCGSLYDKKRETDYLMARIGEDAYENEIGKDGVYPMDFTGRPMRGYIFVTPEAMDLDKELEHWVQLCLDFNPKAKASKKKKK